MCMLTATIQKREKHESQKRSKTGMRPSAHKEVLVFAGSESSLTLRTEGESVTSLCHLA